MGAVSKRFVPKNPDILLIEDDHGDIIVDGKQLAALLAYNCNGKQVRSSSTGKKRACHNCRDKDAADKILPECTLLFLPASGARKTLFASCMECVLAGAQCELAPIIEAVTKEASKGAEMSAAKKSRTSTSNFSEASSKNNDGSSPTVQRASSTSDDPSSSATRTSKHRSIKEVWQNLG